MDPSSTRILSDKAGKDTKFSSDNQEITGLLPVAIAC